jgi:hypothetical protein
VSQPPFSSFCEHSADESLVKNSPVQTISVDNSNFLTFSNIVLDSSAGTQSGLGHNTDGFDVGESTYVNIQDTVVLNQVCALAEGGKKMLMACRTTASQ